LFEEFVGGFLFVEVLGQALLGFGYVDEYVEGLMDC
jgi:hypothetical protein